MLTAVFKLVVVSEIDATQSSDKHTEGKFTNIAAILRINGIFTAFFVFVFMNQQVTSWFWLFMKKKSQMLGFLGHDIKLHLMVRLKFWSSGENGMHLHGYYSQIHFDLEWQYFLESHLRVKLISLKLFIFKKAICKIKSLKKRHKKYKYECTRNKIL